MSAQETFLGFAWLNSTLTGDATLMALVSGVFRALAPDATVPPFVVVTFMSGADTVTMNGYRMVTEGSYQVKVVGPAASTATLAAAAARIDLLLGGPPGTPASGSPTNGKVLACYRQAPFHLDELLNAELWTSSGGVYRLILEQT